MKGRDLIVYILQNKLEDEEIFKDGKFICLLTFEEVAVKWNVGLATISAWVKQGWLTAIKVGEVTYILDDFSKLDM